MANDVDSKSKAAKEEGGVLETIKVVVQALLIALVIRTLLFQPFNIPSGSLIPTLLIGDYLFVHAGIRPGIAFDEQKGSDLRWIRDDFLSDRRDHGAIIVHGHTITDDIAEHPNRIGIDTGAYRSGVLTALVLEGNARRYLQTGTEDRSRHPRPVKPSCEDRARPSALQAAQPHRAHVRPSQDQPRHRDPL